MTDLKPCPFCGGKAEVIVTQREDSNFIIVGCRAKIGGVPSMFCPRPSITCYMKHDGTFNTDGWNSRLDGGVDLAEVSRIIQKAYRNLDWEYECGDEVLLVGEFGERLANRVCAKLQTIQTNAADTATKLSLAEKLIGYADHNHGCDLNGFSNGNHVCTCGLTDIINIVRDTQALAAISTEVEHDN